MTTTLNRADAVRCILDEQQPNWREELRAELDELSPGWESFPIRVWDESVNDWFEVVLVANPEKVTPRRASAGRRLLNWIRNK